MRWPTTQSGEGLVVLRKHVLRITGGRWDKAHLRTPHARCPDKILVEKRGPTLHEKSTTTDGDDATGHRARCASRSARGTDPAHVHAQPIARDRADRRALRPA